MVFQEKTSLDPDEEEKLVAFVKCFANLYEQFLTEYDERLENHVTKAGKWADFFNSFIDVGKGATEGIKEETIKGPVVVGLSVFQKLISSGGNKYNWDRLKRLISQLETFKNNPHDVRSILVESGIEIFEKFASQFVQVTVEDSWRIGLTKLAHDAVSRVLHYSRKTSDKKEGFSALFVTKGVIEGKSKKYKHTSFEFPHVWEGGHTVKVKNSIKWNTEALFNDVGLITTDGKYYRRRKEKTAVYGYRQLFQWECEDQVKLAGCLKDNYQEDKDAGKNVEYKYSACLKERIKKEIILEIRNQTSNLTEGNFEELINKIFLQLDNFFTENREQIMGLKEELLKEISQINEGMNDIKKVNSELHEKMNEMIEKCNSGTITFPYFFDVRESVSSFTGRKDKLEEITNNFKSNSVVVISGLGGVGKSELAVRYAHDRHRKGDGSNVLWINAQTHETAKDSYRTLFEELNRQTANKDETEKSLKVMAKETYKLFAKKDTLLIFDNTEKYSVICDFKPLSQDGFHVLITSQISEVLSKQVCKFGKVVLDELPEEDAVTFVKSALGILDQTNQDAEIKKLVKTLGYLPLALQHAVAYINESKFNDNIGMYVEIYQKKVQERENILNREDLPSYKTVFSTFKAAIDKVKQQKYGILAEKILNSMAYFSPDNIPEEIFLNLSSDAADKQEASVDITSKKGEHARAITLIANYSLISLRKDQSVYLSIHRLVQEVVIRANTSNQETDEGEVLGNALGLLKKFVNSNPHNAASCVPHIMSIWDYAYKHENLVKAFIVDTSNNKATKSTTYFNLIIEGCSAEAIHEIIKQIDPDKLDEVINAKTKGNLTPLNKAVLRKDEKITLLLIRYGAHVNLQQTNGWSPLHFAAKVGSLNVTHALLQQNADVNATTQSQFTPLHIAARYNHKETVEALLAKNANVNAETGYKFTPLHLAAKEGHHIVVETLLKQSGVLINARTEKNATPLHLAALEGRLAVVKVLLSKNPDVNAQNKVGFTPLHSAALKSHGAVVNVLLECSETDVNVKTSEGKTALDLASDQSIIEALLAKNAKFGVPTQDGETSSSQEKSATPIIMAEQAKPFSNSEKKNQIRAQLILMLHAIKCKRANNTACNLKHCQTFKTVQDHMATCRVAGKCSTPHCNSSKQILYHWRRCVRADCGVCAFDKKGLSCSGERRKLF